MRVRERDTVEGLSESRKGRPSCNPEKNHHHRLVMSGREKSE